jgi:carboxypeptidase Taq
MKKEDAVSAFRALMKEINHLHNLEEELMWDTRVNLPPKGATYRGEVMGYLAGQKFKLKTSPKMKELLDELSAYTFNDAILNKMIAVARRDYNRMAAIPADLNASYAEHKILTELVWQEARAKNDYDMVKGFLKKSFDYKREYARYYGFGDNVMDYLLDEWEEGCNTRKVDTIFTELKAYILPMLDKVRASGKEYSRTKLQGHYPREAQLRLIHDVTAAVGYDHAAGRIGESAHAFTLRLYPRDDIRFTTSVFENDFTRALISSMHEGGHAMYAQNIASELRGTTLAVGTSWGFDEGQARFFENFVGRSLEFWRHYYPLAQRYFPSLTMSAAEFYRNLNAVSCGPLRLSADEMTYNLHIIIRYELEKRSYEEGLDIDELPGLWGDKYEEYLGIRPKNDAEGILQDVHWFSGWIGYCQNYVLANCYDGHFLAALQEGIPDFWRQVGRGRFEEINAWHNEHVRQYGALYSPAEILHKFSGETLSAGHYIHYLKRKFEPLYGV